MFDRSFLTYREGGAFAGQYAEDGRRVRDALAVDFTGMVLRDVLLREQARQKFPRLDHAGSMAAYGYLMADRVMARGCEGSTDE